MNKYARNAFISAGLSEPNFMTPKIREYGVGDGQVWEISEGTGFDHEPIFGVTFVVRDNGEWRNSCLVEGAPKSKLCYSLEEAREYANSK